MYAFLAEFILGVHLIYFLFCVVGGVLIVGVALWSHIQKGKKPSALLSTLKSWIENRILRLVHLVAVGIVGVQGAISVPCPLTVWEYMARRAAGQQIESDIPLLSRVMRTILYYDFAPWVFTLLYVGFALLVLGSYILYPPKHSTTGIQLRSKV